MPDSAPHDVSQVLIELGLVVVGLAVLARIASRWKFSSIPLYLLGGLAFGNGGLAPLNLSRGFIELGAEIGVLLLLFMLGLEYSGDELKRTLHSSFALGLADLVLNSLPGLAAGFALGWTPMAAVLLGGVTYISSSSVIAKVLGELRMLDCPETPAILGVLILEDLAMAVFLPLMAALLLGGSLSNVATAVAIALLTVLLVLILATRYGQRLSRLAAHQSDEIILLTLFGAVLLVAGIAQKLRVSSAIGAFLVGIAVSGPIKEQSHRLLAPLRDLFAATFFFFFGLRIDPASLRPVLWLALLLGLSSAATKILTGYWGARRLGVDRRGCLRAGMALVARGEFSIIIAGLGAGLEPELGPLSAAYVLFLAVLGPILTRFCK